MKIYRNKELNNLVPSKERMFITKRKKRGGTWSIRERQIKNKKRTKPIGRHNMRKKYWMA